MKAPMSEEVRKILDNKDTSDLGQLNHRLFNLAVSPVGYRRKLMGLKQLFQNECLKHIDGKETTENKEKSGQETG